MSPVAKYILVEGVNVLDNIYDTDQLSIIRGSSALYKSAISAIEAHFSEAAANLLGCLEAVSTGASSGLFSIVKGSESELVQGISEILENDSCFTHLTFQVVSCQAETLDMARIKLTTQLRINQLQDFTCKPDRQGMVSEDQLGEKVCELEGRRIVSKARKRKVQGDNVRRLSTSIFARLEFGRNHRQEFYQQALTGQSVLERLNKRLSAENPCRFADNFVELCQDTQNKYPKLANKMAVVYIDGNKFGERQKAYIDHRIKLGDSDKRAQQLFDQVIQSKRAAFLADEVDLQLSQLEPDGVIPVETLMWGGDEMLLVMPAWQGFDFLQRFFAADWQLDETGQLETLHHAAGIVFCQASTPIRIIQALAHDLAETVKDGEGGRDKNGWDYLVLESVDYPTNKDLSHYFEQRYGVALKAVRSLGLPSIDAWLSYRDVLLEAKVSGKIAKGQLYNVVNALREVAMPSDADGQAFIELSWKDITEPEVIELASLSAQAVAELRLYQVSEHRVWLKETLPKLAAAVFAIHDMDDPESRAWLWLHLIELWDYLAPEYVDNQQEEAA